MLIVDPGLRLFGSERALLASVPSLLSVHEHVTVFVPRGAELASELRAIGARVIEGPIGRLNHTGLAKRIAAVLWMLAICLRYRIDTLYLNQAGFCRLGHLVARILALRTIVHIRLLEDIPRGARLIPTMRAPIDVITISADVHARFMRAARIGPFLRVVFAYDLFEAGPLQDKRREPAAFACLGRIEIAKGQRELLDAASMIAPSRPDLKVDIIGEPREGDDYGRQVAVQASQIRGVQLLGYRKDAASTLPAYAFLVAPTRYETLGRVIFEGWAAGCVPLCSKRSGGAAEIVTLSGGGLLYEGFDPAALATAMEAALALSAQERDEFIERGRTWMKANTSLAVYQERLSGVLYPA